MPLGAFRLNSLAANTTSAAPPVGGGNLDAISLSSSDYMYMASSTNTGESDNTTATWSCWVKLSTTSPRSVPFGMYNTGSVGSARLFSTFFYNNTVDATARMYHQTTTGTIDRTSSETNLYSTGDWVHIVAAYDTSVSGATPQVYVNGTAATMPAIGANGQSPFPWGNIDLWINGYNDGSNTNNIEVAQLWVDNTYYDLSTDLFKFYDTANNQAVDMGTDGTASGLAQPLIYHNGNATSFGTNGGSLSYSLSVNGTVTTSTGPAYGGGGTPPPPPPPPAGGGTVLTTLDNNNGSVSYAFGAYGSVAFCGTDTSGKPVFLSMWHENANSTAARLYYQMFSADTDGNINKGSVYEYGTSGDGYAFPRFCTEKDEQGIAGFSNYSSQSNYGLMGFYDYVNTDWKLVGFETDVDNKTLTFSSTVRDITNDGVASSVWDIVYVGNRQYVANYRGGNNSSYMMSNLVTRTSGTSTMTVTVADTSLGTTGGMGNLEMVAFDTGKYATAFSLNNNDGMGIGLNKVVSNSQYHAGGTSQIYQELGDTNEANSTAPDMCKLDNSGLIAVVGGNSAGGITGTYMRVGDVTWNTGTTVPSATFTSAYSLDTIFYGIAGITPNYDSATPFTGKAWIIKDNNLQYKQFDYSSGTITSDASWTDSGIAPNSSGGLTVTHHNDGTNTYSVFAFRDTTGNTSVVVDVE